MPLIQLGIGDETNPPPPALQTNALATNCKQTEPVGINVSKPWMPCQIKVDPFINWVNRNIV